MDSPTSYHRAFNVAQNNLDKVCAELKDSYFCKNKLLRLKTGRKTGKVK